MEALFCSCCGKGKDEVEDIVPLCPHHPVGICNECVWRAIENMVLNAPHVTEYVFVVVPRDHTTAPD